MIKISPFLFVTSVMANVAMLIFLFTGNGHQPDAGTTDQTHATPVAHDARGSSSTTATHREASEGGGAGTVEAPKPYADAWAKVQTDDLKELASRLRAEGFPDSVIREIMREQIFRRVDARWTALDPEENTRPFWKLALNEAEISTGRAAINKERVQMLRDVFSAEADPNYVALNEQRRRGLDFLPSEKAEQVMALLRKFDDQSLPLTMLASRGQAQNEKLYEIDAALHKELAMVLTPAELEDYDLRNSRVATSLRFQLSAFDTTEEEFRTLFRLQSAYADRLTPIFGPLTPEQMQARTAVQQQLNNDIKAAFGDQRYEEYRRASDFNYQQAYKLVARLGLPTATTNQVWDVQQDIQKRAASVDRNLAPEVRTQQLNALASEAQLRVTSLLGEAGFAAYQDHGGQWLRLLQPRPAPPNAPVIPIRPRQ
jgi:hypothetical protein